MFEFIKEIFFPKNYTCHSCGIEIFNGTGICDECMRHITVNDKFTCPVCGRRTFKDEICITCKAKAPNYKKGVSVFVYDDGATALMHKFKNGCAYIKDYYIPLLAEKCKSLPDCDVILYVPMTKSAIRKRGYNQAKLLAEGIGKILDVPVYHDVLIKIRETDEQKSLSHKEREENLKGCFKVENAQKIRDKNVLIIDDVLTTGATIQTLCEKLLKRKAKAVYCATVCSVEYRLRKDPIDD